MVRLSLLPSRRNGWAWGQHRGLGTDDDCLQSDSSATYSEGRHDCSDGLDVPIPSSDGFLVELQQWPIGPDGNLPVTGDSRLPVGGALQDDADDYPFHDDSMFPHDDAIIVPSEYPSSFPIPTMAPTSWPTLQPSPLPLGHKCGGGPFYGHCRNAVIRFRAWFNAENTGVVIEPVWSHSLRQAGPDSVTVVPGRHLPWPGQSPDDSDAGILIRSPAISGSFDDDVDARHDDQDDEVYASSLVGLPQCQTAMLRLSDGAVVWQDAAGCLSRWATRSFSAIMYGTHQS